MYYYIYLLVNRNNGMMYIGKRQTKVRPIEDVLYMGSSKYVPKNEYDKIILAEFNSSEELAKEEIRLHSIHNVAVNPNFYNRAKQTSTKFDTTGLRFKLTDEQKAKLSAAVKGKPKTLTDKQRSENAERLSKYRIPEIRKKAANSLKKNGSNKGIKNSQFKPWYISYPTVTHLYYDISKNEKALQDGYPAKYYTSVCKTCKRTNRAVTNRRNETIFVGNIPN